MKIERKTKCERLADVDFGIVVEFTNVDDFDNGLYIIGEGELWDLQNNISIDISPRLWDIPSSQFRVLHTTLVIEE